MARKSLAFLLPAAPARPASTAYSSLDILCLHSMSHYQDRFFDLERDILAPNRTPPLKATKPNFKAPDSPPPPVSYNPPSDYTDTGEDDGNSSMGGRRVRESRTPISLADGVLIRYIDPNRIDIVVHEGKNALVYAS